MKPIPKDVRKIETNDTNWRELVPRLLKIAYYYAKKYNVRDDPTSVAQDAVQSAILKTLSGERKWNKETVDLFHFLAATIRSLISNEARKRRYVFDQSGLDSVQSLVADSSSSVEASSHLSGYIKFLREERPELAPVLMELLSGKNETQKDAAEQLGISPSDLSKKRAQLVKLAERFKAMNVEIGNVSAAQTNNR